MGHASHRGYDGDGWDGCGSLWPSTASRVSGAIVVLVGSEVGAVRLLSVAGYRRMTARQKVASRHRCGHCLLVGELR